MNSSQGPVALQQPMVTAALAALNPPTVLLSTVGGANGQGDAVEYLSSSVSPLSSPFLS